MARARTANGPGSTQPGPSSFFNYTANDIESVLRYMEAIARLDAFPPDEQQR